VTKAPISRLLAYVDSWTYPDTYDQKRSQRAEPLTLRAGQAVLLELAAANLAGPGYAHIAVMVPSSERRWGGLDGASDGL
jgi:hypothetical protein